MFGEKVFELLKELSRNVDNIPAFNDEVVRQVLEEMNGTFEQNHKDAVACTTTNDRSMVPLINYRHVSLERNKRCLLAYLYNRLVYIKEMRWQFGPTLPNDIKQLLCEPEINFFNGYSKNLASYMMSIGEDGGNFGIDLTSYAKPPKSLYIEVRCLNDYGRFELDSGDVVLLKKNSQHYLPRSECEPLIRQGVLKHIE